MTIPSTAVCERTCAHLFCMTTVVGTEGAMCAKCLECEQQGDVTVMFDYAHYCPRCDNDSEDAL